MGGWKRFSRDEKGATAIEFGLLATPFFLILFAALELGVLFLASVNIEHATVEVGRDVMTGNLAREQGALRSALCNAIHVPVSCGDLLIDYREVADYGDIPEPIRVSNGSVAPAAFEHIVVSDPSIASLRVAYPWPLAIDSLMAYFANLDGGRRLIIGSALMRMEGST